MTAGGALFLAVAAVLTLVLPRRLAVLPLLVAAAFIPGGEVLDIGGASFTVPRLLVSVGFLRAIVNGERIEGGLRGVDRLAILWGVLLIGTSAFHSSDAWVYRSGIVWSELGTYFLVRIFLRDPGEVRRIVALLSVAFVPLAIAMLIEKSTGYNGFSAFNGVSELAAVRKGHVRATGPFAHAILAGTTGAFGFAAGLSLWKTSRLHAGVACLAGATIVYASASSGPLLMLVFIVLAFLAWPIRDHLSAMRWLVAAALVLLNAAMSDPVYFLMARIDLVGGSEGWFRAQLIRSAIEHLPEWWFAGTDYTRHWMQTGIAASSRHTDMTNHILSMGVLGGFPLMLTFVALLGRSFGDIGESLRRPDFAGGNEGRFVWTLGALLLGFVMNFLAITMFDQSVTFFWFTVASIASVASTRTVEARRSLRVEAPAPFLTVDHFSVRTDRPVLDRR